MYGVSVHIGQGA